MRRIGGPGWPLIDSSTAGEAEAPPAVFLPLWRHPGLQAAPEAGPLPRQLVAWGRAGGHRGDRRHSRASPSGTQGHRMDGCCCIRPDPWAGRKRREGGWQALPPHGGSCTGGTTCTGLAVFAFASASNLHLLLCQHVHLLVLPETTAAGGQLCHTGAGAPTALHHHPPPPSPPPAGCAWNHGSSACTRSVKGSPGMPRPTAKPSPLAHTLPLSSSGASLQRGRGHGRGVMGHGPVPAPIAQWHHLEALDGGRCGTWGSAGFVSSRGGEGQVQV